MGRMAEARKRARRGGAGTGPEPPSPPADDAAVDPVFADDPAEVRPAPAPGERIKLPPSGLAEEILRILPETPGVPAEPSPAAAADVPEEQPVASVAGPEQQAHRIELPASGLAEEILAAQEAPVIADDESPAPAAPSSARQPAPAAAGAHSMSFFAAPAHEQRAAVEATEHLATFFLDREEYGVDVRQVQEIRRVTEITTVPRAPEFIRGVINLRGRILPVLDLRRKLGLGEVAESRSARIVVVRLKERLLGLLVDGASQVLKVPLSRIEPAPDEVVERGGDYIRGVAKLEDRLIILVDLERLLAHELKATTSPAGAAHAAVGQDGAS